MSDSVSAAAVAVPANPQMAKGLNAQAMATDTADPTGSNNDFNELFANAVSDAEQSVAEDTSSTSDPTTQLSALATATIVTDDGNSLPSVAWSGTFAVGDEQRAAAVSMDADNSVLNIGKPVVTPNLTTAWQASQQQPKTGFDTSSLPAEDQAMLAQKFELPPAMQLTLAGNHTASVSNGDSNPLINTAALTSATTAMASPSVLTYANNAKIDHPVGNIPANLNHANWGSQLGDGVRWMVGQQMQQADLRLNPPELGMLEVRIQMNSGDQATITFSSPHAAVRDAVEHALPRLREMLGETGVMLGNVNVSQHSFGQHHNQSDAQGQPMLPSTHSPENSNLTDDAQTITAVNYPRHGVGLVDLYA